MRAGRIIAVGNKAFFPFRFRLGTDSLKAYAENLAVVNGNVTYAVIKLVARGKKVMLYCKACFGCHILRGKFTGGLAFPVFVRCPYSLFCVLGNIKWVGTAVFYGVKLTFKPFKRKLGECLTAAGGFST